MANYGNFLEYAGQQCGIDVGYGKMLLVYGQKASRNAATLTATAINADIENGAIIGIIKGWHTIAGAPVAEINVERTGTAEMKLIRSEIAADTLTFENSIVTNEILNDVVKAGSLNCILIDDQGNAFGDYAPTANEISTMLVNFSGKTTSSFQKDNVTEKTVAVTARYLVKEVSVLAAETETELVESKVLVVGQLIDFTLAVSGEISLLIKDKSTNKFFDGTIGETDITVLGTDVGIDAPTYTASTGVLIIPFLAPISAGVYAITISGDTFYMKETQFTLTA